MNENMNNEIMDKLTKVCLCKALSRAIIKKAIKNGAKTLKNVQKVTGAGSGACNGKRCTSKIDKILKQEVEKNK
ncbi:(2Fe-2S)-binding protein [Clostridium psychrophilum]|uniref:(2Fe-2S)-binding protein n=1 Tax=Clostridium psychrophilum TaxID=132926 RepID=UPI001C0BB2C7|nr:(2Fe-2S)-binding protein [Clostridium psychrophilum]MBU3182915.1 (2Fe-2S)-binding protein [Clostridium psychrophilum]